MNQIIVTNPITEQAKKPDVGDLYRNPDYPSDVYVISRWDSVYQLVNILTGEVWHAPSRSLEEQLEGLVRVEKGAKIEITVG
jgi:hypothetical protein